MYVTQLMIGGLFLLAALLIGLIMMIVWAIKDSGSSDEEDLPQRADASLWNVGPLALGAAMILGGMFFLIQELFL